MKNLIKLAVAAAAYLGTATTAFADTTINSPTKTDFSNLGNLFTTVFGVLIGIVGGLAIIFIVIGGIRYIIARGDPKATDGARNQITAAIIGLIIALLAVAIVVLVGTILGANQPLNVIHIPGT